MNFILLIGCLLFSSASGRCPDGFVTFGLSCYYFSHDVGTWIGSQVACNQAFFPTKANLVEINDQEENHFLYQQAKATQKDYWVGASDLQIAGMYRWLSGKVVSASSSHWIPGQPSRGPEHCMNILQGVSTSNCWNDAPCNSLYYFICETPAN
ncbi:C-type lectin domain family 4 member E-like [Dreissena polymorpha]|uniref:C-type lectin domain-containing protein n=1 Tax=Dreissena polymorpha TaxID=45954 RepID=A0A9D4S2D2_DREPO|nr:C-type lectin domain family 4 member E-like [Dreissena polymorpha]KAH3889276.1 hypothetical protein DPMN_013329 [Dreissena polymorpha]